MIILKNKLSLLLIFVAVNAVLVGCSAKSSDDKSDKQGYGKASFIISGAVDAQKDGTATIMGSSNYNFKILITDNHKTYNLNFGMYSFGNGPVDQPAAGNYVIKESGSKTTFTANYQLIDSGTGKIAKEFNTVNDEEVTGGMLTVENTNENSMAGRFQFTAAAKSGEQISIKGKFKVKKP